MEPPRGVQVQSQNRAPKPFTTDSRLTIESFTKGQLTFCHYSSAPTAHLHQRMLFAGSHRLPAPESCHAELYEALPLSRQNAPEPCRFGR
jgi:hypothetical protein